MYHIFLIHSSAEGTLGCFQVLAMTNNAAMNITEHMSSVGSLTASGSPPIGAWNHTIYTNVQCASGLFSSCGIQFLFSIPAEDSDL
ncbi:hypothetical protein ACRRTK_005007 [Alexandromys fortis]